ncbi:MAG: hypothetical protein ACO3HT_05085 [Ilumatobacteraceae bacterium]
MSDDNINYVAPDEGEADAAVTARLRSALLDDVAVDERTQAQAVLAVIRQLDRDSSMGDVAELSSRRRVRINSWLQIAAAVVTVAVGAGVFLQLQTAGDDSVELSVKESSVERSQADAAIADMAEETTDAVGGAVPEAESLEAFAASEESMQLEEEMALEDAATADMAYAASTVESISREELPELVDELLAQDGIRVSIGPVCGIDEGEWLIDVELDGELVSIVYDVTSMSINAINLSTCEVVAEITPGGE